MKIGDVVELNSGGPKMTVIADFQEYSGLTSVRPGYWLCAFFGDHESAPQTFWTHQDALRLRESAVFSTVTVSATGGGGGRI